MFAGYQAQSWTLAGHINHSDFDSDGMRQLAIGGMSRLQQGGSATGGGAELTLNSWSGEAFAIYPTASVEYTDFSFDAATSSAGAASLAIASRSVTSLQARVGASMEWSAFGVEPRVYLGMARDYGDGDEVYSAAFSTAPAVAFSTPGSLTLDGTWYEAAVGFEKTLSNGAVFSFTHQREISRNYLNPTVTTIALSLPF